MNDLTCSMPDRARTSALTVPFQKAGAASIMALAMALSSPCLATDAPPAAPAAAQEAPTILVTAQRRAEDAKNVPISLSVLSGKELENRKVTNFEDLARITPGIAIYNTGGSNLSRIIVRGVSSTQGTATVAVYLDDVSMTVPNLFFTGATLPRMVDINHVESLRGPQGTLFGASALGGALRFITNKPDLEKISGTFAGDVSRTEHAGANYQVESVLNVPIVKDQLALRVAVQNGKNSGFVDRIDGSNVTHKGVDQERYTAIRTTLLYKPNDALSIEPAMLWQKTSADGTSIFYLNLPAYQQSKLSAEPNSDELFIPSLTLRADLGGGINLTSVTSYLDRRNFRQIDGQVSNGIPTAAVIDPSKGRNYTILANLAAPYVNNVFVTQWSQELRLSSASIKESGKPYEVQGGAYVSRQKVRTDDREYVTGLGQTVQALYGVDASSLLGAPLVNDLVGSYTYTTTRREIALFAEGSLQILTHLKATVGARQSFSHYDYQMLESGYRALGTPATVNQKGNNSPITPKFALTWEASRTASLYGNISKGYRLGGNNSPLPATCGGSLSALGVNSQGTYTPDSLWSYEGGAKLRLFNGRLSVNASGYHIDWSNIQQSVSLTSCGYVTVVNAGAARSDGGELEISAKVTRGLTVGGSGSITHASITNAAPGSGTANGQWLLYVPRSSITGYVDYEHPLSDRVTGTAHLDANFLGRSRGSYATSNPDYERPGYSVVNANLGLRLGAFTALLYVQNLFDQDKIIQRPLVVSVRQGLTVRPRTIGISGRYTF